nr:MAG TPA: hypothetical protein [Caudoviricetes sp.]DAO95234.1 MAG TPA: hypothetical protein [Caudoviricetes sp.]
MDYRWCRVYAVAIFRHFKCLFTTKYTLQDNAIYAHGHYRAIERAIEHFKMFPIPYLGFNLNAL